MKRYNVVIALVEHTFDGPRHEMRVLESGALTYLAVMAQAQREYGPIRKRVLRSLGKPDAGLNELAEEA